MNACEDCQLFSFLESEEREPSIKARGQDPDALKNLITVRAVKSKHRLEHILADYEQRDSRPMQQQ